MRGRRLLWLVMLGALCLMLPVQAAEVPQALWDALPEDAEELLDNVELEGDDPLGGGVAALAAALAEEAGGVLRQRLRGAVSILLVVVLCSAVEGMSPGGGLKLTNMAGALSVTLLAAGSLESLIGMGSRAIQQMTDFSAVLLPVLAAAAAMSGAVTTATLQQVATVLFAELLLQLIQGLLLPMVYLYIGAVTAAACLPDGRLGSVAEGLRKGVTWMLCGALTAFTLYLSIVRVVSGAADASAVKLAKAAVSGVVPVVGGIIAEAAETVLAGAGLLRAAVGVFGTLAVLGACAWPFLHLGIQYLMYKFTAFLSALVGSPELCRLIDGLGSAFGLVLGMTGACALLLLVSILSSVALVA